MAFDPDEYLASKEEALPSGAGAPSVDDDLGLPQPGFTPLSRVPAAVKPLGKVTSYGYTSDPHGDSASLGRGKYKVPTGAFDNQLRESSLAVSPDIQAEFRRSGINPGDPVELTLADGRTVTRTYDDHTATDEQARGLGLSPLRGRFDFYSPQGVHDDDDTAVVGFRKPVGSGNDFDPDAYLASKEPGAGFDETFDPDRYLTEREQLGASPGDLLRRIPAGIAEAGADAAAGALKIGEDFSTMVPASGPAQAQDRPRYQGLQDAMQRATDELQRKNTGVWDYDTLKQNEEDYGFKIAPVQTAMRELERNPDNAFATAANFMREVSARSRGDYGVDPRRDEAFLSQVASGAGSIAPAIATGPAAPLTMAGMMGEAGRKEAEQMGATPEQQDRAFYGNAAVGVLSEALMGVPALLRSVKAAKIPQATFQAMAKSAAFEAFKGGLREGTQEAIEQVAQNTIAKYIAEYDPNRELTQGAGRSFLVGATIGGPTGAVFQTAQNLDNRAAGLTPQPAAFDPDAYLAEKESAVSLGEDAAAPAEDPLATPLGVDPSTINPQPSTPVHASAPINTTPLSNDEKALLVREHSFPAGLTDYLDRADFDEIAQGRRTTTYSPTQAVMVRAGRRARVAQLAPLGISEEQAAAMSDREAFARLRLAQEEAQNQADDPGDTTLTGEELEPVAAGEEVPFSANPELEAYIAAIGSEVPHFQQIAESTLQGWATAPNVVVAQDWIDLPRDLPLAVRAQLARASQNGMVYDGFYRDGTVYLLADGLVRNAAKRGSTIEEYIPRMVVHETVHHFGSLKGLFPAEAQADIERFTESVVSKLTEADQKALKLPVYAFDMATPDGRLRFAEEAIARYAETAQQPSWFRQMVADLRALLRKWIPGLEWSNNDIAALLSALRRKRLNGPTDATMSASATPASSPTAIGRLWQRLAQNPETQRLGAASTSTDMATLLREIGGPQADRIRIEPLSDNRGERWGYRFNDSAGGRLWVDASGPNVSIDSEHTKADGTLLYQTVYAWAHNNGRRVIGDPSGVSWVASLRRASHMLSSALRFNTTRHLLPDNAHGIVRHWRLDDSPEATAHNIGLLAQTEARMVFDRLGDLREYSFHDGSFYRNNQPIPAPEREATLRRAIAAIDSNFARGAGASTLARALVTRAAQGSGQRPGGLLLRAAAPSLEPIRYSAEPAGPGEVTAEEAAQDPGKRRKFIDSVKANPNVQQSVRDRIESIYQPITNKATVDEAKARIDELGIDRALAEVLATSPRNPPTALTNAMGIELISRLQAVGRFDEEAAIATHIAEQATSQGQAIQALSLMSKLSAEGINVYAQRLIQQAVRTSNDPEVQKLHAEIQRLKDELRKARMNHGTKAVLDIGDMIREAGLPPEKQVELQQKLRAALIDSIANPGNALARITQILINAGVSREKAVKMAKKAIESFAKAQKAARDKLLRQMLKAKAKPSDQDKARARIERSLSRDPVERVSKSEIEKWLEMNDAGVLDDEKFYAQIAKKYGIPVFTREHAQRIQALQREYEKAPAGDLKLAAAGRMMQALHELVPVDNWTKVRAVRNMLMLLNPKTIIRNVAGNITLWLADGFADTLAWGLDGMTSLVTGARTRTGLQVAARLKGLAAPIRDYRTGYDYAKQQGQAHGLWKKGIEHMLAMSRLTSRGVFHEGGLNEQYRNVFSGRLSRGLENTLTLALGIGDRAFHQSAFLASIDRQMSIDHRRTGVRSVSPTREMVDEALLDANAAIFQDDNVVSKTLGAMQRTLNLNAWGKDDRKFGLGNVIVPFTQVPGSIVSRAIGTWSPVGFIRGVYAGRHLLFKRGQFDQRAFTNLLSRGALGTGLGYLGVYLFKLGILSALPEDDPDREAMRKAAGLGQYRINVSEFYRRMLSGDWHSKATQSEAAQEGDVIVNYDWMQPLAVPLAAGAQLAAQEADRSRELAQGKTVSELSGVARAAIAGLQTLEAQPLVSSLARFMGTASREATQNNPVGGISGAVYRAATQELLSGFVPTLARQITALGDNTVREDRANPIAGLIADVPGFSQKFPPRYDVLGEMQQRYQYGTNTLFNVMLNPAFVSRVKSDPVLRELDGLYERTGESSVLLRQIGRTVQVNGQSLELTNEQRSDYQRFVGQVSGSLLKQLISSPAYANLPDAGKARFVSNAIAAAASAGKIMQLGDRPRSADAWTMAAVQRAQELGWTISR